MSIDELFPEGAAAAIDNPECPRCGHSLDFIRVYVGTEVRGVNRLVLESDGGGPRELVAPDLGECDEDGYDYIISERLVCGGECGFELGVTAA